MISAVLHTPRTARRSTRDYRTRRGNSRRLVRRATELLVFTLPFPRRIVLLGSELLELGTLAEGARRLFGIFIEEWLGLHQLTFWYPDLARVGVAPDLV